MRMSRSLAAAASVSQPIKALVLTMVPNGGGMTEALTKLGYTPYVLEDTFTHGRALTHPQQWISVLDGTVPFNPFFLDRTSLAKTHLPKYDCIIGPPATLAFESILKTCPWETRVILVEAKDRAVWAKEMETMFETLSNYKNHSGPGLLLYRMVIAMMDFYKCSSRSPNRFSHRSLGQMATSERLAGSLELFEEHVKATVSADRLLVYRHGDGWLPLCEFLNKPVPRKEDMTEVDFPIHNNGLEVFVRIRDALSISRRVIAIGAIILLSILWVISSCAMSQFYDELTSFYQYTRGKFAPYLPSEGEEGEVKPPGLTFRKALILAKKSVLEYGAGKSKGEGGDI